jgi:hypothetical protein
VNSITANLVASSCDGMTYPGLMNALHHPYACLRGDIETMAGVTLEESSTKTPRFKRWQPHPQDAISPASGSAPAHEGDAGGRKARDGSGLAHDIPGAGAGGIPGKDEQGLGGSRSPLRCQPSRRG